MQRKRRRIAMIVAIVLAALMILPVLITGLAGLIPEAQGAPTQKSIDALKKERDDIREKRKVTQGQIKDLRNRQADVVQRKTLYDDEIAMLEQDKELTAALISQINADISERQQELDEARAREADLQGTYIQRIRAMENMGDISYLSILLQAESLTDFLTRWDSFQEIMRRDQELADELLATRLGIEDAIAQLDEDKREQNEWRREQAAKEIELAELLAEVDVMMAEYSADMAKLIKDEKTLAEAEAKADKEVTEQEAELARIIAEQKKRNNKYVGGAYTWPVPGYYTVSSKFGPRIHPIYKVKREHTGIDIPAPKGTNVTAANSGEIITMTKSSGYGNYVVIDHGGGQATLYAHLSGFSKSYKVGSKVKTGDVVGYIGSTGVSTGNHLHFEIIINGARVDPEAPGRLTK